jgi:hypothetical protein
MASRIAISAPSWPPPRLGSTTTRGDRALRSADCPPSPRTCREDSPVSALAGDGVWPSSHGGVGQTPAASLPHALRRGRVRLPRDFVAKRKEHTTEESTLADRNARRCPEGSLEVVAHAEGASRRGLAVRRQRRTEAAAVSGRRSGAPGSARARRGASAATQDSPASRGRETIRDGGQAPANNPA